MFRLLFVCTGNLYRSPLAAAFFSKKLSSHGISDGWIVASAGTWAVPGKPVARELLKAASRFGVDLRAHRSCQLDQELLSRHDLILVMEMGHREALWVEFPALRGRVHLLSELADRLEYEVADPAKSAMDLQEWIAEMSRLIDRAYPGICRLAAADEYNLISSDLLDARDHHAL